MITETYTTTKGTRIRIRATHPHFVLTDLLDLAERMGVLQSAAYEIEADATEDGEKVEIEIFPAP